MDKQRVESVIDHISQRIDAASFSEQPFVHLTFSDIFPKDLYEEMLSSMPKAKDYRALPGRNGINLKEDGTSTRVKIDLFPEFIRKFPKPKQDVWKIVGKALCSDKVLSAFKRKLAPGLQKRFGDRHDAINMYPIPVLMRDVPGYKIRPHPDTHWKGITVQLYLPKDNSHINIGTVFHGRDEKGKLTRDRQMSFSPNTGYAFAVTNDSWHSADAVGDDVDTRDSILLTYFVDSTALQKARNRFKRVGNFILNEAKGLKAN